MKVGFSGTRNGLTSAQRQVFELCLPELMKSFRHGCCIGADEEAAITVHYMGKATIYGHPSNLFGMTSEAALATCVEIAPPCPPLQRNMDIVNFTDILIAWAGDQHEEQRSGTWACIRYARKLKRPITICWPDGQVTRENQ